MKIEFEVQEEKLVQVVSKDLSEYFLYHGGRMVFDTGKLAKMSSSLVKEMVSEMLKDNWDAIEEIVMRVTKEYLERNARVKNGRLKTAIEKALQECGEDSDE